MTKIIKTVNKKKAKERESIYTSSFWTINGHVLMFDNFKEVTFSEMVAQMDKLNYEEFFKYLIEIFPNDGGFHTKFGITPWNLYVVFKHFIQCIDIRGGTWQDTTAAETRIINILLVAGLIRYFSPYPNGGISYIINYDIIKP